MKRSSPILAIIFTLAFLSIFLLILNSNFKLVSKNSINVNKVVVTTDKETYHPGDSVKLTIHNNTPSTITYSWYTFEHFSENKWSVVELITGWTQCGPMQFLRPSFPIKPMSKYSPNYQWTLERFECISGNEKFNPNYTKVFNRETSKEYWYLVDEGEYRALIPYRSKQTNKENVVYSNTFEVVR